MENLQLVTASTNCFISATISTELMGLQARD
jgi:hypothetical protein